MPTKPQSSTVGRRRELAILAAVFAYFVVVGAQLVIR
jgi:hypothetical protein